MTKNKKVSLFTDIALERCVTVSGGTSPTGNATIDAQIAAYEQATGYSVVLTPSSPPTSPSSSSSSPSSKSGSNPLFPLPYQTSAGIVSIQASC